ncbi:fumarylacetoacetate hydrolase family protein [Anaeromyxobacter dehalogenans]|uniref:Fumarylacetoacetate (FAA) hydrolase n=1 Tax=Anaeromyxobacter dehalogenans (strain 2CP-C) TaxID=290397 RepID=Q2IF33_ANADE|nr:fumarylacetoacetate hydrolase family protein [Anaeromyxobacter dehalogenans]ABC83187.1 Fumarylacetoacetate (FAA) hydrolase [Anaeromyxobacter dehalogenans 2CP-C]
MRLATQRDGSRDGRLMVVRRDGEALLDAAPAARTLQDALDRWEAAEPKLRALAESLDSGRAAGVPLDPRTLHSPLPRAYEWVDGSAYLNHVRLVRKARGAEPPPTLETDPLVYQGGSGVLLAPTDDLPLPDPGWGLDLEGEVCCILGDVPRGTRAADAGRHVRLLCLANDVTLRNLVPGELAKGFGFFQSKPATAFSPFAVTPDEVGPAWRDGRLHLRMTVRWNGAVVGTVDAGPEMHFSFFQLLEHVARTRGFTAGTILGSGTVSNADRARGWSCIAEQRALEMIDGGAPRTRFLAAGDTVEIEVRDGEGRNVFGTISQKVRAP